MKWRNSLIPGWYPLHTQNLGEFQLVNDGPLIGKLSDSYCIDIKVEISSMRKLQVGNATLLQIVLNGAGDHLHIFKGRLLSLRDKFSM